MCLSLTFLLYISDTADEMNLVTSGGGRGLTNTTNVDVLWVVMSQERSSSVAYAPNSVDLPRADSVSFVRWRGPETLNTASLRPVMVK